MGTPVQTSSLTAWQAAEYVTALVGQEAAQLPNIRPLVWEVDMRGKNTTVAHLRNLTPLAAGLGTSATENNSLPTISFSPVASFIDMALYGFSASESKMSDSISPDVLPEIAQQSADEVSRQYDVALAQLFPSLTAGTVGTASAALTVASILTAEANLYAQHAEVGGAFFGILQPQQFLDLQINMISLNFGSNLVSIDGRQKEYITIGSTKIYRNTLVSTVNTGASYGGAVFSRQALAIGIAQDPRVEIIPIPGKASWSIDTTTVFGVDVWRPTFGAYVVSGITA